MTVRLTRAALAMAVAASLVTTPIYAQTPQAEKPGPAQAQNPPAPLPATLKLSLGPDYSTGKSAFPNFFSPYSPMKIGAPVLTNSPRIDQLIQDGKLRLSLEDAIALALENNLDITVQRYTPWIAETDLLRTKAGGAARGLGGTGTASALGAIPAATFDPVVTTTLNWQRASFPVNNPFLSGVGLTRLLALTNYNAQANVSYSQGFHTGTAVSIALNNTRSSTTSPVTFFNPSVQSSLSFSFQQQLLNGFGLLPNTRFILEAKNTKHIADLTFTQQVINTVSQVENLYWELVFARENVNVSQAAVAFSQKLYEDNKRQVEIGTLAPIEVVRAESEVASDRQKLIVAQTTQLQQQTLLLNAITKNPMTPDLQNIEILPTTEISTPPRTEVLPLADAVKEALQKRPDVRQMELNLKNAGIEVRATRNAMLPTMTLFGQYSAAGLGGNSLSVTRTPTAFAANTSSPLVDSSGNPVLVNGQPAFAGTPTTFLTTTSLTSGGLGDALDNVINNNFPTYAVGLNFTLPIRNRSAQADNARALLSEQQLETQYRQIQNTVIVDVRNAQIALEQDRARVDAAEKARVLAQQTLNAEQKKYQLGASTIFFVIQAQRDLIAAQGNELRAKADLEEAMVSFDRAIGRTLEVKNITIADAKRGRIYRAPEIPGTPDFPGLSRRGQF